jgi:AcrR family transcriptional regulator
VSKPRRATPLDREARRTKIIEAITPLLMTRGADVTTRELAEAAGVAEGTLFNVFDDKRSLLLAAIQARLDPEPLRASLSQLPEQGTLEEKLLAVAQKVLPRLAEVHSLAVALHGLAVKGGPVAFRAPSYMREWLGAVAAAVAAVAAPHAAELRVTPRRLAQLFTTLLFASRMPHAAPEEGSSAAELVRFCLEGALISPKEG